MFLNVFSILLNISAPVLPEPPLLLLIIPIMTVIAFWRPDRLSRIPMAEREALLGPAAPIAPSLPPLSFPTLPTNLKRR